MARRRRRPGRLLLVGVLVGVVLAVLATALPARAVAAEQPVAARVDGGAAECDLDGDGLPDGWAEHLVSDGADEVAARVAGLGAGGSGSGLVLVPAAPTEEWALVLCHGALPGKPAAEWLDRPPELRVRTASVEAEQRLLADAEAWAAGLPAPVPTVSPPLTARQTVGLEVWLAAWPDAFVAHDWSASAEGVTVTARAVPVGTEWTLGDDEVRCDGPGVPRAPGTPLGESPPCGGVFDEVGSVEVTARTVHEVAVSSSFRVADQSWEVASQPLRVTALVGEVQAWNVAADAVLEAPPEPEYGETLLEQYQREQAEEFCQTLGEALGAAARWSPFGIGAQLIDLGADAIGADLDLTGGVEGAAIGLTRGGCELVDDIGRVAQLLFTALEGCFSNLADAIADARALIGQLGELARDPVAYVTDLIDTASAIGDAFMADPQGVLTEFAADALSDALSLDELDEHGPAFWVGRVTCQVARWVITGGPGQLSALAIRARHWTDDRGTRGADRPGDGSHGGANTHETNSGGSDTDRRDESCALFRPAVAEGPTQPLDACDRHQSHDQTGADDGWSARSVAIAENVRAELVTLGDNPTDEQIDRLVAHIDELVDESMHHADGPNPDRLVLGDWQDNGGYVGEATTNGGHWYQNAGDVYAVLKDEPLTEAAIKAAAGRTPPTEFVAGLLERPNLAAPWVINQRAIIQFMRDPNSTRIDLSPGNTSARIEGGETLRSEIDLVEMLAAESDDWTEVLNDEGGVVAWQRSAPATLGQ